MSLFRSFSAPLQSRCFAGESDVEEWTTWRGGKATEGAGRAPEKGQPVVKFGQRFLWSRRHSSSAHKASYLGRCSRC